MGQRCIIAAVRTTTQFSLVETPALAIARERQPELR